MTGSGGLRFALLTMNRCLVVSLLHVLPSLLIFCHLSTVNLVSKGIKYAQNTKTK